MKITLTALCLAAIPTAAIPTAALAQQPPPQALLQANVANRIGTFWTPTQFRIVAKQFNQNPLKPSFVLRFQLDATNPAALYVPNGKTLGPQDILVETVPARTARTFYGTENLTYAAGAWSGPTVIENPADKLGKPLDLYTVPTLVLGSDQYKQAVALQTTFSLDARKAAFQKQLDALEQADAAKAADVEKSFAASLHALNASFTDKLTRQQATLTAQLAAMLTSSRHALADQQKQVEQAWTDLVARQHAALASLKLGLQTTQQAVAAKIKLAKAAIDSQTQLIALQKQALANNATIASLQTRLAQKAKAQLLSFEGTWSGSFRCDKKRNGWYIYATQMTLTLAKQTAGMLSGQMTVTGGDTGRNNGWGMLEPNKPLPASLQITNAGATGPVQLNILTTGRTHAEKQFLNFEVQLDPSGVLKGHTVQAPPDCSAIFSR